jgi:hypothetical protein
MATTKKATTGQKAGAGSRKKPTKAKVVATTKTKSKATAKSAPAPKAAPASKKAAPVKLNDRQRELLQKVKDAGEAGYCVAQKAELRSIDALAARKLLKKGAKNKATGATPYHLTKAAGKHLPAAAPAPAVTAEPVPAPAPAPSPAAPLAQAAAAAPPPPPAM